MYAEPLSRAELRVSDLPRALRPREKLIQAGAKTLSHVELLAVILGTGTRKDDVLKISNAALRYRPPDAAAPQVQTSAPAPGSGGVARPREGTARDRRIGRTVYVLQGNRPQPVQIKTGISDGVMTEVIDGLKEGEHVVTAQLSGPTTANAPQQGNPFGGPRRF